MAVPWGQIVNLMPSIIEVSRELLKRVRRLPPPEDAASGDSGRPVPLEARVAALEENERRQAELVQTMADQLAQLVVATSALHKLTRWLIVTEVATAAVAIGALAAALR